MSSNLASRLTLQHLDRRFPAARRDGAVRLVALALLLGALCLTAACGGGGGGDGANDGGATGATTSSGGTAAPRLFVRRGGAGSRHSVRRRIFLRLRGLMAGLPVRGTGEGAGPRIDRDGWRRKCRSPAYRTRGQQRRRKRLQRAQRSDPQSVDDRRLRGHGPLVGTFDPVSRRLRRPARKHGSTWNFGAVADFHNTTPGAGQANFQVIAMPATAIASDRPTGLEFQGRLWRPDQSDGERPTPSARS